MKKFILLTLAVMTLSTVQQASAALYIYSSNDATIQAAITALKNKFGENSQQFITLMNGLERGNPGKIQKVLNKENITQGAKKTPFVFG